MSPLYLISCHRVSQEQHNTINVVQTQVSSGQWRHMECTLEQQHGIPGSQWKLFPRPQDTPASTEPQALAWTPLQTLGVL